VLRDVFEFMKLVELKKNEKHLCNFEIRWQKSTKNCTKPFLNTRASFKKNSSNGLIFESHVPMDVFHSCDLKN
jgi:hypothetical protein